MKKRGIGCACVIYPMDPSNQSSSTAVFVRIFHDGSATIWTGATDLGQGSNTVLPQMASEILGIPVSHIKILSSDTEITPYDEGTGASRTTYIVGTALREACEDARYQLFEAASRILNYPDPRKFVAEDGRIYLSQFPELSVSIAEAAWARERDHGFPIISKATFGTMSNQADPETGHYRTYERHVFGTHICEIEVDTETGMIDILRYVAVHDPGKVVNPMLLKGQIEGGVAMGIGQALFEDMREDPETGQLRNNSFADYLLPTAKDMPRQLIADFVEYPDPESAFGALGIGEATSVPTCPAIANALYDAVGVRITELPMTPQRVLEAIAKKKEAER